MGAEDLGKGQEVCSPFWAWAQVGHIHDKDSVLLCIDGNIRPSRRARVDGLSKEHARLACQLTARPIRLTLCLIRPPWLHLRRGCGEIATVSRLLQSLFYSSISVHKLQDTSLD